MLIAALGTVIIAILVIYACLIVAGEADVRIDIMRKRNEYCGGECKFCHSKDRCNFNEDEWD
jgi:hypothetical protein